MTDTVLAFDTSSACVAACLLRGPEVLCLRHEEMARGQAERLVPMLEEMLAEVGLGWRDLDALGVCTGPGNFTGIRISVATARGLALSLGIPAVGVTAPEGTVWGAARPVAAAVFGSRRMSYAQRFGADGAGPVLSLPDAEAIAAELGELPILSHSLPFARPAQSLVEGVARVAGERLRAPDLPRPSPVYVRPADAAPSREAPPAILP